ncbi:hypothetical protein DOTSEDRAFT_25529 [Dothistroma septosporum NZE10]|uniref:Uncharacterized protein n=1 Tax=Dothistroma septosporum (strain NZE10 / CBS 128990) TaxID=675120 RepID=M2XMC6_DOTSN|nr:hypothetical protein DOTSEDRAFT_25529 [Dothistroma septosporum NZE10]
MRGSKLPATVITTNDNDETTLMTSFAQTNITLAFTADTSQQQHERRPPAWSFRPASPTNNANPSPLIAAPAAGQATLEQATRDLEQSGVEYPYNGLFDPTSVG